MATINLGAIKFNWKGAYNGATAYAVDDVVSSGGSSYVCILASTGNATSNGTYWEQMSSAGTNGTDGTDVGTTLTTQGDILYRDGSGLQRLAKGTASQELRMNSGATAPEWYTPAVASSDVVKISTGSFSNVSLVSIDGDSKWGANNTYAMHKLVFYNYNPASNSNFMLRQNTNNSTDSSAMYSWTTNQRNSSSSTLSTVAYGDQDTSMQLSYDNLRAGVLNNIEINIHNMRVTDGSAHLSIVSNMANPNQDGVARMIWNNGAGITKTTNTINTNRTGLSIYANTGNISGNYAVYGFKR
jgi:hypothetical protein